MHEKFPRGQWIDHPDRQDVAIRFRKRNDGQPGAFLRVGGVRLLLDEEAAWAVSDGLADILKPGPAQ